MRQEQLLELVGATNPVAVDSKRPERFPSSSALLTVIDERSRGVQTSVEPRAEEQRTIEIERGWGTRRRLAAVVAGAAAVIAAIVLALVFLVGDEGTPDVIGPGGEPIPDFSQDRTLVGAALTAAYDSADPEAYLELLSQAQLTMNGTRTSISGYQNSLLGWHRTVDSKWEFTDCQPFGNKPTAPITCDTSVTFRALGPELGAFTGWALIQVVDGTITEFEFRDLMSATVTRWAYYKTWTQENHPELARQMWVPGARGPVQNFSEESALLHLQLFPEFAAEDGTS